MKVKSILKTIEKDQKVKVININENAIFKSVTLTINKKYDNTLFMEDKEVINIKINNDILHIYCK